MQFWIIMWNKFIAVVALVTVSFVGWGQNTNSSPYTRYAFGELNRTAAAAYFGMGGVTIPNSDYNLVNINNPASYSYIKRYNSIFNVGVNGKFVELNTNTASETTNAFGLGEFIVGLPVGKKGGAAFGLVPYSTVGYRIVDASTDPVAGDVDYIYEGDGGINRAFVGFSRKAVDITEVLKTDSSDYRAPSSLSIGVNASYLFGNYSKLRSADFSAFTYLDSRIENRVSISDFIFDAGLLYHHKFGADPKDGTGGIILSLGANATLGKDINAKRDEFVYTYRSFDTREEFEDTIYYSGDESGTLSLPLNYGIGAAITFNDKLKVGMEFRAQDWSSYKEVFGSNTVEDQLANSIGFGFGLQYQPKNDFRDQSNGAFKLAKYRMGFRYDQTPLQIDNTQLNEVGMSFGVSVPMRYSFTSSMLNFGVEVGQRGTTDNNLIQERFVSLKVGLTIMPGRFDNWFYKRKYD